MIYILEDDDNIRKLINYTLRSQGYEVQDFSLPSLFHEAVKKRMPDMVLLDIMLPEEDGISILHSLKTSRESKQKNYRAIKQNRSISGFAEILKAGGTDENTTKDFALSIYDESQRMRSLVNDIIKLSIVKHAAKYHDASILLNSEIGKGSTFTVIFSL